MKIRMLVLGDERVALPSIDEMVELTLETEAEIHDPIGRYRVSERSLQLAREATLEKYDVIIIGNNLGTGQHKAAALPYAVRDRTMIVWNEYLPGDERPYAAMGFIHFGNRHNLDCSTEVLDIEKFIRLVVAELSGVEVEPLKDEAVAIAELDLRCGFYIGYYATRTSQTCDSHATSIAVMPDGHRLSRRPGRCDKHEGMVDDDTLGEVIRTIPQSMARLFV